MNPNLVPSLILAASILGSGLLLRQEVHAALAISTEGVLQGLEKASKAKNDKGESTLQAAVATIVEELSSGVKAGFTSGMGSGRKKTGLDQLAAKDVKFVPGRMDNEEKIIGVVHNSSPDTYTGVELSLSIKDKDGKLIDVINEFVHVPGEIAPGKEVGFAVGRPFKPFGDKNEAEVSASASAEVTIVGGEVVK